MSKTLCLVVLFLAVTFAKADERVNVIWSYADFNAPVQTNKPVTITPLFTVAAGVTNFITGDYKRYFTDINGSVLVSNVLTGYGYRVALNNAVTTTVTNYFPTNLSGTVYAISNTVVPTNLITGLVAYSMAQSDARFAPIGGGSGGATNGGGVLAGMLTNANFSATGTNAIRGIAQNPTNIASGLYDAANNVLAVDVSDNHKLYDINGSEILDFTLIDPSVLPKGLWTFETPPKGLGVATNNFISYGTNGLGTSGNSFFTGHSFVNGKNLYQIRYDVGNGSNGFSYGYNYAWSEPDSGYEPTFINNVGAAGIQGYFANNASTYTTNSEKRFASGVVTLFGPNGKFGSKLELLPRRDMTYETTNNSTDFFDSFVMDGRGGLSLGDNPNIPEHTKDWKSSPWVRIRGSSDNTRSQFQLEGTGKPFIGTVTNGAFFNDGTNVSLAQAGGFAPIAIQGGIGMPVYYFSTNEFTVTNIVTTNAVGYSIKAAITNNGLYEIVINAIARGNQSTDRPFIVSWITNNVAMGYVYHSRAFAGNGYAGWSSGFEQGAPTPGFILATNTSGLDTFWGNRPISESRPVGGTSQSTTADHHILMRLTNAPLNLFVSCTASATGTNTLKSAVIKITRIE